jgi:hypothetical protein
MALQGVVRPMVMYVAAVWWPRVGLAMVRADPGHLQRLESLNL